MIKGLTENSWDFVLEMIDAKDNPFQPMAEARSHHAQRVADLMKAEHELNQFIPEGEGGLKKNEGRLSGCIICEAMPEKMKISRGTILKGVIIREGYIAEKDDTIGRVRAIFREISRFEKLAIKKGYTDIFMECTSKWLVEVLSNRFGFQVAAQDDDKVSLHKKFILHGEMGERYNCICRTVRDSIRHGDVILDEVKDGALGKQVDYLISRSMETGFSPSGTRIAKIIHEFMNEFIVSSSQTNYSMLMKALEQADTVNDLYRSHARISERGKRRDKAYLMAEAIFQNHIIGSHMICHSDRVKRIQKMASYMMSYNFNKKSVGERLKDDERRGEFRLRKEPANRNVGNIIGDIAVEGGKRNLVVHEIYSWRDVVDESRIGNCLEDELRYIRAIRNGGFRLFSLRDPSTGERLGTIGYDVGRSVITAFQCGHDSNENNIPVDDPDIVVSILNLLIQKGIGVAGYEEQLSHFWIVRDLMNLNGDGFKLIRFEEIRKYRNNSKYYILPKIQPARMN